jgi:hypothetical protein
MKEHTVLRLVGRNPIMFSVGKRISEQPAFMHDADWKVGDEFYEVFDNSGEPITGAVRWTEGHIDTGRWYEAFICLITKHGVVGHLEKMKWSVAL